MTVLRYYMFVHNAKLFNMTAVNFGGIQRLELSFLYLFFFLFFLCNEI